MTFELLKETFDSTILKGTTLILPTVSTGNVPQLTLDLFINSIENTQRLGSLQTPFVLNVCGPDAFGNPEHLAMPIEVYVNPDRKLTILQFRAPIIQACAQDFCSCFMNWITQHEFNSIFLLASADAAYRPDSLIEGTPSFRSFGFPSKSLCVKPLETEFKNSQLKGAALFSQFLSAFQKDHNFQSKFSGIIVFTLEGDNMQDTMMTWNILQSTFNLPSARPPNSWKQLYGAPLMDDDYKNLY